MNTYGTANSQMARIAADPSPIDSRMRNLKNFWEINAEKEREEAEKAAQLHKIRRPYGFPKWRSSDAMTASLVASVRTPEVIPADSRLPEQRINMIYESEKSAQDVREEIKRDAEQWKVRRKSTGPTEVHLEPVPNNPWYQPEQSHVERSSIANSQFTRSYFESGGGGDKANLSTLPKRQTYPYNEQITIDVSSQPSPQIQKVLQYLNNNYSILRDLGVSIPLHLLQSYQNGTSGTQHGTTHQNSTVFQNGTINGTNYQIGTTLQNGTLNGTPYQNDTTHQNGSPNGVDTRRNRPMSFLEREVFEAQKREAEFQQSRQELGMMTLQDTIHLWKSGQTWDGTSRPNSSSGFNEPNSVEEYGLDNDNFAQHM
ncbi:unnamed protein product [Bursaphelenchus okinawaensis]|uniref:Uncharacterized protein n=1 Tax=Bursaphelenchus okinawaensis TaxID=465554 RepID=A0A811KCL2_9BILA|nr:unnamed protein product [Bursaphelenchus okinawaensis]CAG9098899.1 unnamed protein product [Bursaphelenchus okinawaensis]